MKRFKFNLDFMPENTKNGNEEFKYMSFALLPMLVLEKVDSYDPIALHRKTFAIFFGWLFWSGSFEWELD
jgi:hypothetical protein